MSDTRDKLAAFMAEHESDVTSYDAHDIDGCVCGWELPRGLDYDDRWPAYHAHVADALLASDVLRDMLNEARAEAWQEGVRAVGVFSGPDMSRYFATNNPYRGAQDGGA